MVGKCTVKVLLLLNKNTDLNSLFLFVCRLLFFGFFFQMSPHKYVLKYTFSQCNDDIIKCISSPCNSLDGLYNAKVITTVIHKFAHIFSSTILDVEQCKKKKQNILIMMPLHFQNHS